MKALNAKDAVVAANCYTADRNYSSPKETPVKGRANIQKYWEGAISAEAFDAEVATTKQVVTETWAIKLDNYKYFRPRPSVVG